MAAEPVWQPNYVELSDDRTIRFGAQCVICDARYATPGELLDTLLVRDAIPAGDLRQEIESAKRYIFNDFANAYSGMLVTCFRCQRPACPDCWDDDNKMCGECVAARGLARSPRRGLPSSNPLSDGRLARVEPGRYSDAQRPSWLDELIATQPLDGPLGTPPKQPVVKPRPPEEPPNRALLDAALRGASSPGAAVPNMPSPNISSPGMFSPGVSSPGMMSPDISSPGMFSPGMMSPGMSSPGMFSPGTSSPGMFSPGMSSPGVSSPGMMSPGVSSPGMFSPGMSSPGMSSPGAMDRTAQSGYPGAAFALESPYASAPPPPPLASQAGMGMPGVSAPEQFSPFSPPAAPPPQTAGDAWGYAGTDPAHAAGAHATAAASASSGAAMVVCPRCGTSNYDFVSRCTNCQLRLIQNCPRCQQLNSAHSTQCEYCGEPLSRPSGWSQLHIPAVPGAADQTRGRGKNGPKATGRHPKAKKDEHAVRQARGDASAAAGRGTGEMRAAQQTPIGQFVVQSGVLVHYMEAHPAIARLTLWGERLLTAIVVFFVAGLLTSVVMAELSATANETLRAVLHVDIRQVLEHFVTQMQILIERLKH